MLELALPLERTRDRLAERRGRVRYDTRALQEEPDVVAAHARCISAHAGGTSSNRQCNKQNTQQQRLTSQRSTRHSWAVAHPP